MKLGEYEVEFDPWTTIKTQALDDVLQETTLTREKWEWKAYLDGSVTNEGVGVGVKISTPEGEELKFAIHFKCPLSNNEAEYEPW